MLVLFLLLYVIFFTELYIEQQRYDRLAEEKRRIEKALMEASCIAAESYENVINEAEEIRKSTVSEHFSESFYVTMSGFTSKEEKEYVGLHIPLLILAEEDGAHFLYWKETKKEEGTELEQIWSEKIPYLLSEKQSILDMMEVKAAEFVSKHNYIASQYGIDYQFHAPRFLQDNLEKLEFPVLFVVFQGWPLLGSRNVFYENCIDAALYIKEKERYTVLESKEISTPFCTYHHPSCRVIWENNNIRRENITLDEVVEEYGAYPCEQCIKE